MRCALEELVGRVDVIDGAIVRAKTLSLHRVVAQTYVDDLIDGCEVKHPTSGNFALTVS